MTLHVANWEARNNCKRTVSHSHYQICQVLCIRVHVLLLFLLWPLAPVRLRGSAPSPLLKNLAPAFISFLFCIVNSASYSSSASLDLTVPHLKEVSHDPTFPPMTPPPSLFSWESSHLPLFLKHSPVRLLSSDSTKTNPVIGKDFFPSQMQPTILTLPLMHPLSSMSHSFLETLLFCYFWFPEPYIFFVFFLSHQLLPSSSLSLDLSIFTEIPQSWVLSFLFSLCSPPQVISSRVMSLNNIWSNTCLREVFLLHDYPALLCFSSWQLSLFGIIYI